MEIPSLLLVHDALSGVPGVAQSYWVLRGTPALAAMPYPSGDGVWGALAAAGFSNVVCLSEEHPLYDPGPLTVDGFPLEDLIGDREPSDPQREAILVRQAASRVTELLREGRSVVVHCVGGRGRTGTVVGTALVGFGLSPSVVAEWLDSLHRARKRDGWPESNWQRLILEGGE